MAKTAMYNENDMCRLCGWTITWNYQINIITIQWSWKTKLSNGDYQPIFDIYIYLFRNQT